MTPSPRRSWVRQIMGLPISVLARGPAAQGDDADAAVHTLYAELVGVDEVFSPYREDSVISRLARGELRLADCEEAVREVAQLAERARVLTGGLFDARRPDGRWDPSGLVKGWAVERAARHLAGIAGVDWCVNAGGDVVVVCPSGVPFIVGIQDPFDSSRITAALPTSVGGVATSGTAARGQHLYDPRNGAVAALVASVTVAGPSLESADVLATAAFVAGNDALRLLDGFPDYEAMLLDLDGHARTTAGWTGSAVPLPQPSLRNY